MAKNRENTFGYQVTFGSICLNTKFKIGKAVYSYVGKTNHPMIEPVTFLDGRKSTTVVHYDIYVVQNQKGKYKAFHSRDISDRVVTILK